MEKININKTEYPARLTMGALLRYKQETGREVDALQGASDALIFLHCCVKSACAVDGIDFPFTAVEMADRLDAEAFGAWYATMAAANPPATEAVAGDRKKKV